MVLEKNETPGEEESHHEMLHRVPQVPEQALWGTHFRDLLSNRDEDQLEKQAKLELKKWEILSGYD